MNRDEIRAFLPHREPMLLMDEAFPVNPGEASGSCLIHGDEFFLQGHFPGFPVVPGVILCEMIAQSAGVLVMDKLKEGFLPCLWITGTQADGPPGDRVVTQQDAASSAVSCWRAGEARATASCMMAFLRC